MINTKRAGGCQIAGSTFFRQRKKLLFLQRKQILAMYNTSNKTCRCIVRLLERHGVKKAIVSPGSRNAPLLVALSRNQSISKEVVVDERCAAFIALGYSLVSQEPVALVCTSGTALLNYAPAIAEAYYRRIPLIVISADRPKEWIGQDDSQTIVQPGALSNYVKRSYDISTGQTENDIWYANRVVNDALLTALSGRIGPVHINLQLDEPLGEICDDSSDAADDVFCRKITMLKPKSVMDASCANALGEKIASPCKVMIIAGFLNPDKMLNDALLRLSRMPNIVVLTETIANLHGDTFINSIDAVLSGLNEERLDDLVPDMVISTGGALVSRHIKQYIRRHKVREHWHVGEMDDTVDCFKQLTMRVEMSPSVFFSQLASGMPTHEAESDYAHRWEVAKNRAGSLTTAYAARSPWSDFKAFSILIPLIPKRWNVHFSNGTAIRYAQIFGDRRYHRCDCNRGVSGIDGCTSTAVGASLAYKEDVTLLVSGDMSARYDIGAIGSGCLSPRFKMIVIDNGGGGIFRFISSTSGLDIREEMFCHPQSESIGEIADSMGFKVYAASDENELRAAFSAFASESESPALLLIHTPAEESAEILKNYFIFCKTH